MPAKGAALAQPSVNPYLVGVVSWALPGAGHLWLGRRQKGIIFLVTLLAMLAIGSLLDGRLFPFELTEPLVFLFAIAQVGLGAPYFGVRALGWDRGDVTAINYDYGNAFLIAAGLFNMLVALDAFDIASGRK